MTFHDRARMLKALAQYLSARKNELYELSYLTGATKSDSWIDIDGGIGTTFVCLERAARDAGRACLDGVSRCCRGAATVGQRLHPLQGVAVHINAFNFRFGACWRSWPTLRRHAGYRQAGDGDRLSYRSSLPDDHRVGLLPRRRGAARLRTARPLLDRLGLLDAVSFTGSAVTGVTLRGTPNLLERSVRFWPSRIRSTPPFSART